MFKMVNRYGNAHKVVKTERERDELLRIGYTEEKEDVISVDDMTVAQLKAFAKEKGIDLSECKNKAEKLEKIKNSIEE